MVVLAIVVLGMPARADRFGASSRLSPTAGQGGGLVEVSPTAEEPVNADGIRTFHVQGTVNVHGAVPDARYRVARAVDLSDISDVGTPNGQCPALDAMSPSWRPVSGILSTDSDGGGALHFEIAPPPPTRFVSGVSFDVQWQVIKVNADGTLDLNQELRSECFTVAVK